MKPIIYSLLLACFILISTKVDAQPKPVPISYFAASYNDGIVKTYPDKPVFVTIQLKNKDNQLIYMETHADTLTALSGVDLKVGTGAAVPPFNYNDLDFTKVSKYCVDAVVTTDQGPVVIPTVMDEFGAVPSSNHALNADNANALGGWGWQSNPVNVWQIQKNNPGQTGAVGIVNDAGDLAIINFKTDDVQAYHAGNSHVTGNPLDVWENKVLQNGSLLLRSAPGSAPGPIKNMIEICAEDLNEFLHGLGIIVKNPTRSSDPHVTAAIYGENITDPLGVGVFANGGGRGSFNQGQTGAIGTTVGEGNGAGLWGYVGAAPAAGGFKYALTADNQNLPSTYAAAIFGNGFYTGTWSMVSDARLKTGVRSKVNALEQIGKLKPAQYNYVSDSPYRLPEGIHYGFIAQEVEEVMPELVEDIILPKSMDPATMANSGSETYKAINYTEMIPLLTAALQELSKKVDALALENEGLKKQLQACKPK